jgi:hypothetical protein
MNFAPPLQAVQCTVLGVSGVCVSGIGGFGCPTVAMWNAEFQSTVPISVSTT